MPTLTYPGVYIQEISSGVRPIDDRQHLHGRLRRPGGDGTGPAYARHAAGRSSSAYYGSFIADGYLAHSVFQYFNNGGRQCYIVRVTRSDAVVASVTVQNRAATPVAGVTFSAKNKGAWGNCLVLQIEDGTADPGNEFKVSVRRQTDPAVVPANFKDITPLEVFDNLSIDPNAPNYVVSVLAQNSTLIDAHVLAANTSVQRGIHRGGFGPTLPLGDHAQLPDQPGRRRLPGR